MSIKNNERFLRDDWFITGNTLESFNEAVEELASVTDHVLVNPKNLALISVFKKAGDRYGCAVIEPKHITGMYYAQETFDVDTGKPSAVGVPLLPCPISKVDETLMDESTEKAGFVVAVDKRPWYVSESARGQLLNRIGLAGQRASSHSLPMTICIADAMVSLTEKLTLAVRKDDQNRHKIFGVLSAKYQPVSQNTLNEIIAKLLADKTLGEPVVKEWIIDHSYTRLYIEFPDAAEEFAATYGLSDKNIPGLVVMSSDTGDCSVSVKGTYRRPGSRNYAIVDEVSHRHIGNLDPDEIVKACDDEVIAEFRKLPEALAEKIGSVIGNGDVSTPEGRVKNGKAVRSSIRRAMEELGINKALADSKKRLKDLSAALCAEVNDSVVYTEYDLAQTFLGLPNRLEGLGRTRVERIARCCGKAPYISFGPKSRKDDNAEIILLPEGEA